MNPAGVQVGLPAGALSVITGNGPDAGAPLRSVNAYEEQTERGICALS